MDRVNRIPILKLGHLLLVSIQVDMHDRMALALQEDLAERISDTGARGGDGHPDQLAACTREICDLPRCPVNIGRVGIGHRLYDDRMIGPDRDTTDSSGYGMATS